MRLCLFPILNLSSEIEVEILRDWKKKKKGEKYPESYENRNIVAGKQAHKVVGNVCRD